MSDMGVNGIPKEAKQTHTQELNTVHNICMYVHVYKVEVILFGKASQSSKRED